MKRNVILVFILIVLLAALSFRGNNLDESISSVKKFSNHSSMEQPLEEHHALPDSVQRSAIVQSVHTNDTGVVVLKKHPVELTEPSMASPPEEAIPAEAMMIYEEPMPADAMIISEEPMPADAMIISEEPMPAGAMIISEEPMPADAMIISN